VWLKTASKLVGWCFGVIVALDSTQLSLNYDHNSASNKKIRTKFICFQLGEWFHDPTHLNCQISWVELSLRLMLELKLLINFTNGTMTNTAIMIIPHVKNTTIEPHTRPTTSNLIRFIMWAYPVPEFEGHFRHGLVVRICCHHSPGESRSGSWFQTLTSCPVKDSDAVNVITVTSAQCCSWKTQWPQNDDLSTPFTYAMHNPLLAKQLLGNFFLKQHWTLKSSYF